MVMSGCGNRFDNITSPLAFILLVPIHQCGAFLFSKRSIREEIVASLGQTKHKETTTGWDVSQLKVTPLEYCQISI